MKAQLFNSSLPSRAESRRTLAMFMMGLRVEVSTEVITGLTPEEHSQVAHAIADLAITESYMDETSRQFRYVNAQGESFASLETNCALHLVREALHPGSPLNTTGVISLYEKRAFVSIPGEGR